MNISSNYDYSSQLSSTQELLRLLQKRNVQDTASSQGTTSAQDLFQPTDYTLQPEVLKPVSPLSGLVSDGTITSEQEQAVKEALDAARMAYQTKSGAENASGISTFKDPLASLVSAGTITEDQEAAVKNALGTMKKHHGMPPPQMSQGGQSGRLSNILDSLVTDGTLTEDQETSVLSTLNAAFQTNTSGQSGTGTDAVDKADPLDSLVAAGTITQDQKDEIKSTFEEAMRSRRMPPPPPLPQISQDESSDTLASEIDDLVKSGAITSDQQKYIMNAIQSAIDAYSSQSSYSYEGLLSNSYEAGV